MENAKNKLKRGLFGLSPRILQRKQKEPETSDASFSNFGFEVEYRDSQGSERQEEGLNTIYGTESGEEVNSSRLSMDARDAEAVTFKINAPHTPYKNEVDKSFSEYDKDEMAIPTEEQSLMATPLIQKSSSASKGAGLWSRVQARTDSIVFSSPHSLGLDDELDEDAEARKMRLSQHITNEIRSGLEFTLSQCLLAILAYLIVAVVAYSFVFEHWSVIDSLYFACVTFTTIGYGDLVPSSDSSRLFTALFALSGVACLGIALGVLGSNLIEAQVKTVERARNVSQRKVMNVFDASQQPDSAKVEAMKQQENLKQTAPWYRSNIVLHVLPLFSLLFICCELLGKYSGWNFISTFYFCIISASTVGFGDLTPQTQKERLVAVLFIPVAVGAMGQWLSVAANGIIEQRQQKFRKAFEARELTLQDLVAMDDDGDGKVTFAEYLEFMLVAMNKVDKDLIRDLRSQFDRLDVDGTGILEKEDLVVLGKRKLKSTKRKMELSQYKKQLLLAGKDEQDNKSPAGFLDALQGWSVPK